MKNKIFILISSWILTLIALLAIQSYFIFNTYNFKKKEILIEVKNEVDKIDNEADREVRLKKDDFEQEMLVAYSNKELSKELLIKNFQKVEFISVKNAIKNNDKTFKKLNYDVAFTKNINSVVAINKSTKDTLVGETIQLYSSKAKLKDKIISKKNTWNTYGDYNTKNGLLKPYHFEVKFITYFSVNNLKELVLKKMFSFLLISFFLMLFVFFLFYITIKNLIKQKKIAEIQRDFINNITHEFKTPLATLSIATKTLNTTNLNEEMVKSTVAIIERQNNRLQNIVNQVNFDSLLLNVADLKLEQNINQKSIGNCITDFQIANPAIKIISELNTATIDLKMSKFHFNTILVNLLENAVKYGGTQITITTKSVVNTFILSIKDNGIGIQKKEQNAIFEKFYRIQNGDIHNTKGLGLGLFYTREIIESHQGKVHIESQENKGATFIISIPI
jgi:two-component system phosphate regulon sensor histidine kinase PhoR